MNNLHIGRAILFAPLITPFAYLFGALLFMDYRSDNNDVLITLFFISSFTLPVSYASTLIFGIPIFFLLKKYKKLSIIWLTTCGSIAGMLVFILFVWSMTGFSPNIFHAPQVLYYILAGGFLGGSVAVAFGIISGITKVSSRSQRLLERS